MCMTVFFTPNSWSSPISESWPLTFPHKIKILSAPCKTPKVGLKVPTHDIYKSLQNHCFSMFHFLTLEDVRQELESKEGCCLWSPDAAPQMSKWLSSASGAQNRTAAYFWAIYRVNTDIFAPSSVKKRFNTTHWSSQVCMPEGGHKWGSMAYNHLYMWDAWHVICRFLRSFPFVMDHLYLFCCLVGPDVSRARSPRCWASPITTCPLTADVPRWQH